MSIHPCYPGKRQYPGSLCQHLSAGAQPSPWSTKQQARAIFSAYPSNCIIPTQELSPPLTSVSRWHFPLLLLQPSVVEKGLVAQASQEPNRQVPSTAALLPKGNMLVFKVAWLLRPQHLAVCAPVLSVPCPGQDPSSIPSSRVVALTQEFNGGWQLNANVSNICWHVSGIQFSLICGVGAVLRQCGL